VGGQSVFRDTVYISELHEEHLPEVYFPIVGAILKHPRYKNKRAIDPFIKTFVDEKYPKVMDSYEWGLPFPNEVAALKNLGKFAKDVKYLTPEQVARWNLSWTWMARHFEPYMKNSKVRSYQEVKDALDMIT